MLNTCEKVHEIIPTKYGDHVSLKVTFERGKGYRFDAMPFFDCEHSRDYLYYRGIVCSRVSIFFDCARQSKKRYEEAKKVAFGFIYSDAGRAALNGLGIVLLGLKDEQEYDRYA